MQVALEDIRVNENELFEQNREDNAQFLNEENDIKERLAEADEDVRKHQAILR
jgi:hypothetical protein